jgi:hypothetical protein
VGHRRDIDLRQEIARQIRRQIGERGGRDRVAPAGSNSSE